MPLISFLPTLFSGLEAARRSKGGRRVRCLEIPRIERYLRFHLAEIVEELKNDDGDSMWNARWGGAGTILREFLQRSRDDITSALIRIQERTYGNCVGCGSEIEERQLEIVPWVALCIVCQEECDHQSAEHTHQFRGCEVAP